MHRARHAARRPAAWARRTGLTRLATAAVLLIAVVVTTAVVTGGSSQQRVQQRVEVPEEAGASLGSVDLARLAEVRQQAQPRVSRTASRVRLTPRAVAKRYATEPLNLWTRPGERGPRVGLVKAGSRLAVTGQRSAGWAEILLDGKVRWVNARYLAKDKPEPESGAAVAGLSGAACADGSSVESGLTAAAVRVYRAVCAAFPQPTTYGGYDGHGEHADGRAIDIMISGAVGWQIAEWLRANAGALQVRDIIYSQHIWTPERSGEGWRSMSDRGSTTANHYDHVHVAVF